MKIGPEPSAQGAGHRVQRVGRFARRLLSEWKRLGLPAGAKQRLIVAVSGGADSTALLLALEELSRAQRLTSSLTVAHLDHGLRGEAGAADARWVGELAAGLGFEVEAGRADICKRAAESRDNLEQSARRARYEFLTGAALKREAHAVLTAHTMEDQAETVLLRLMRGSGAEGLSGIEPVRALSREREILLVRPLLRWARRAETEEYCRERGVRFRIDEMNLDEKFARVRVRRSLLPLMLSFNGRVVEALSRTAELLRDDDAALAAFAEKLLSEASAGLPLKGEIRPGEAGRELTSAAPPLRVDVLQAAQAGTRRRALRLWLAGARGDTRRLEFVHLRAVELLLEGTHGGREAQLPGGGRVYRKRGWLYLYLKKVEKEAPPV